MGEKSIWDRTEGLPHADRVSLAGSMVAAQMQAERKEREAKKKEPRKAPPGSTPLSASIFIVVVAAIAAYFIFR